MPDDKQPRKVRWAGLVAHTEVRMALDGFRLKA
jgi:hypothetical protein